MKTCEEQSYLTKNFRVFKVIKPENKYPTIIQPQWCGSAHFDLSTWKQRQVDL